MSGSILLKQKDGLEHYDSDPPFQTVVPKGELVVEIPVKERVPREDGKPTHNYSMYTRPAVTLYDDGTNVSPLEGAEMDYLAAVEALHQRIVQYHTADKLKWIMDLRHDDIVIFRLKIPGSHVVINPRGRVRYYGRYKDFNGVMFGLEILDDEHRGKGDSDGSPHFKCGHNNAVYVSMEKIFKKISDFDGSKKHTPPPPNSNSAESKIVTSQPHHTPADCTRSKTAKVEVKENSLFDKAKKKLYASGAQLVTLAHQLTASVPSRFSTGDRIVLQTADGAVVRGTVCWTGPVKMSRETGGIVIPVVGIETNRVIDHDRDFPGLHYEVTGSHGSKLFTVAQNHSRIFVAEMIVLTEDEYKKQKNEDHSEEAIEAKKFGVTVEELRQQGQLLSERNEERNLKYKQKHSDYFSNPNSPRHQQRPGENTATEEERGTTGTGNHSAIPTGPDGTPLLSDDSILEQQVALVNFNKQKSHDEDYVNIDANKGSSVDPSPAYNPSVVNNQDPTAKLPSHCGSTSHSASNHEALHGGHGPGHNHTGASHAQNVRDFGYENMLYHNQNIHQHKQPSPKLSGTEQHLSSHYDSGQGSPSLPSLHNKDRASPKPSVPRTSYDDSNIGKTIKPRYPSIPSDISQFTSGTLVDIQMQDGRALHGTVKWMGTLPGYEGYYAGVELDNPFKGCSDGSFQGQQYFKCPPSTGFFCLASALKQDRRYMDLDQVPAAKRQDMTNPLSNIPQYDDSDTPGDASLFHKYIGDEHGIQGHHNSCYLDATTFGLFALSDSFDELLLMEPDADIGKRIKHILWKGIVNPLRKYGVARFESIMELRNELEKFGAMKGANTDEKDPEEFLNLLFKEILHVEPFISIKRPFGVEKEFFVQLFFELESDKNAPPADTEKLVRKMFHEQNISFTSIPSKLLLQMPRFGKDFKMFNKIIPALEMDVLPVLDPAYRGVQTCQVCMEQLGTVICRDCTEVFCVNDNNDVSFCKTCSKVVHKKRSNHKFEEIEVPNSPVGDASMLPKMQLLSVICIETSHYVCFTRTKDKWLFHDSMANRLYDMYNIPKVTDVSKELNNWVYSKEGQKKLLTTPSREIPECVRRFTQDIYMCVYINPDLDRYGVGIEDSFSTSAV